MPHRSPSTLALLGVASAVAAALGCNHGAAPATSGAGGASGSGAAGSGASGSHAGSSGASGAAGGTTPVTGAPELHTLDLGARVYATAKASFFEGDFGTTLLVVATADPETPIKLLAFDAPTKTWSTKFTLPSGGVLPRVAHRIDAVATPITGGYAPTLLFGARTEAGLVNEGLFMATWGLGHYDVVKVPDSDAPGMTFVALADVNGLIVASCDSSGAAQKTAAMLWLVKDGALTLVASLPGELAVDATASPIANRPVVANLPQSAPPTLGETVLVARERQPGGGSAIVLTPFSLTGFGAGVTVPIPAGVDFYDNSNAGPYVGAPFLGARLFNYVLFGGVDGFLYHLELDGPLAQVTLTRGPEHVNRGSSMVIGRFAGTGGDDLVQGWLEGSAGLDLMTSRAVPFALYGPPPGGKTTIPTGPALWPIGLPTATDGADIFAITKGTTGVFDTALMAVVPPPTAAEQAAACFQPASFNSGKPVCALPEPCPKATGTYAGLLEPIVPTVDVVAAKCILQDLRDDVVSHLVVNLSNFEGSTTDEIWVEGDGSAMIWRATTLDIGGDTMAPRRFMRKDKAFFDACLQETTEKALVHCLYSWWVDDSCFPSTSLPCPAH